MTNSCAGKAPGKASKPATKGKAANYSLPKPTKTNLGSTRDISGAIDRAAKNNGRAGRA